MNLNELFTKVLNFVKNKRESQAIDRRFEIPVPKTTVPKNSVVKQVSVTIPSDSSFNLKGFTGSFTVPTGEVPDIAVQITDTRSGNPLTEGFVELSNVLSPGAVYPDKVSANLTVFEFDYLFSAKSEIQFQFINRSTTDSVDVKMTLHGRKLVVGE